MPINRLTESETALRAVPGRPGASRTSALAMAAVALFGIFGHCAMAQEALSGEQIRSLITGNTLEGAFRARRLVMVFYADGQVRGSLGLTGSDSGTWEIKGDTYCNEWFTYFNGVHRCYQWVPDGDGYLLINVDAFKTHPIEGRIVDGKPKGY